MGVTAGDDCAVDWSVSERELREAEQSAAWSEPMLRESISERELREWHSWSEQITYPKISADLEAKPSRSLIEHYSGLAASCTPTTPSLPLALETDFKPKSWTSSPSTPSNTPNTPRWKRRNRSKHIDLDTSLTSTSSLSPISPKEKKYEETKQQTETDPDIEGNQEHIPKSRVLFPQLFLA